MSSSHSSNKPVASCPSDTSSTKLIKKKYLCIAIAACLSTPLTSTAQTEPVQREIESIIVTGQKTQRNLQDTTTSVAVITEIQMEQKNILNFVDTLTETANAFATNSGGFSIRGIDGFNVSGGGNSYLASVYVDGAALPQRMIQGGSFSTWDASQVEILRGPQSTLQGRNALAGAVIMNTKVPTQDWQGKYRLQSGENGQFEAGAAIGGGLIKDQLSFRLSAENREADGANFNVTRDEPSNYREDQTYRLKFLIEPEAIPDFSALLSFTQINHTRGITSVDIVEGGNPFENRSVYNNDKREQYFDGELTVLELSYELNDNITLASYSTRSDVDSGYTWDTDGNPATGSEFATDTGSVGIYTNLAETLSQEFRANFDFDHVTGVAGLYYFDTEISALYSGLSNYRLERLGLTSTFLQGAYGLDPFTADLAVSQYAAFDPAHTQADSETFQKVKSHAFFADATWTINEDWDLYAGIRWDKEKQENSNSANYIILNANELPDPASYAGTPYAALSPLIAGINNYLYGVAASASSVAPLHDAEFDTVLPKIGASYHWTEDLTTSITAQKGYRSGGVGINTAQSTIFEYDPEYTNNYEISVRSSWLDGALIANANAFYIDWKDQQVAVQLSTNTYDIETRNAGSSSVQGFELELNYYLDNNWLLYGSLGQAKSEFKDFIVEVPASTTNIVYDLTGRSFADSPEWTGNIGATYTNDTGFFANFNINYADDSVAEVNPYGRGIAEGDPRFDLDNEGRTLVNFQVGYEWERVGLYLIGRNILDEEYITYASIREPSLGDPRQLSLSVRGNF